ELVGMMVGDMTVDYDPVMTRRRRGKGPIRGQSSINRRDGKVVEIEWVTVPTEVAGLPNMVSVCWRAR
ncbi:MAG: hypothetical protein ACRDM1_00770, partial [Gaiellaceae bacterium]